MRTHLTEQQERIAILALERGLKVWRDGSVSISTTSRSVEQHAAMAAHAQQVVSELLAATPKKEAA